ncbi:MAG: hypothetical protein H6673_04045 [Anaerolineales bacterium]|nr:hypothetical protein [Anaerolineales bacterium]
MRRSVWHRIRSALLNFLDQLFMIFNLPTLTSDLEGRLRRLRRLYYHNPTLTVEHGRIRDILHGHVEKRYRAYYERLLSVERIVYQTSHQLPRGTQADELLYQTQQLGDRIAALIDEYQVVEQSLAQFRDPSSPVAHQLYARRENLREQLETNLARQAAIPAHLESLYTTRTQRQAARLTGRLENLTDFLNDVESAYAELDAFSFSEENDRKLEQHD